MLNDPTLFIDSVSDKKEGNENQEVFDSRVNGVKRNLIHHRVEDIKAMSFFKMNIFVVIKSKDSIIEGLIENVDDDAVYIRSKDLIKRVFINDIEDIIIKKI